MKIAICDDIHEQLQYMEKLTKEYLTGNTLSAEVILFNHSDKLMSVLEKENFQIYILDIVMPMVNGIELGGVIRRLDREAQIIYTTTAPEYALESFIANPINYLIKPIHKEQFFDTLRLAISKIDTKENIITVKTKEGLRVLNCSSIVYCEKIKNSIKYVLVNDEVIHSTTIRTSLSQQISTILSNKRFLQPHASFVVNMNYIEGVNKQGFTLKGGGFVPIAQKQYAIIRRAYFDYMFDGEASL